MAIEPVPFHVPLPGREAVSLDGIRSESHRVLGLLHLADDTLTFEWSLTRRVQQVSLTAVRDDDESTTPELLDVPRAWIAEARLTGGWWAPRLRLRARRLDAFEGVPSASPGTWCSESPAAIAGSPPPCSKRSRPTTGWAQVGHRPRRSCHEARGPTPVIGNARGRIRQGIIHGSGLITACCGRSGRPLSSIQISRWPLCCRSDKH